MKYSKQESKPATSHVIPPKYIHPKARGGSSHIPMARRWVGTKGKPTTSHVIPPNYVPPKGCGSSHIPMAKHGLGTKGRSTTSHVIPPNYVPPKDRTIPMARRGVGTKGRKISLVTEKPRSTQVEGRVLEPPKLKFGNDEHVIPCGGSWNFNKKDVKDPYSIIQENQQSTCKPASARVELMFEAIERSLPTPPQFLLCILPEKHCDIYGPWKRKCLVDYGIVTQCMAPTSINPSYLANLLLKINAKMGGINHLLSAECLESMPLVSKTPTIIFGMAMSSDVPSIAVVVGSRKWPPITQYRASVRAQYARVDTIGGLFKPVSPKRDEGMIRELLEDFYQSTCKMKPEHIIIFRDGVNESQFDLVLNIELDQIIQACKFINDDEWNPKFLMIVAQKTHRMKFLQPESDTNAPPGTIVDAGVCHPKNNDFYLCAQNGPIGNARSTHYHVLLDQIGFSADKLQELIHSLSYTYQTSTNVRSVVAPICYAHQAVAQMSQIVKSGDTESNHSGGGGGVNFTQFPKLHEDVCSSMFFC